MKVEENELTFTEKVKVVVRCRPLTNEERKTNDYSIINVIPSLKTIQVTPPNKSKECIDPKTFTFDAVYGFESTQQEIYQESIGPFVESVMDGFDATIFAYGQTGAGKTYTMDGNIDEKDQLGIMPRCFDNIFEFIDNHPENYYKVCCSYLQVYLDEIQDLLVDSSSKQCELKFGVNDVYIKHLTSHECKNADSLYQIMKYGNMNKKTGRTMINESSSRSHTIFIVTVCTSNADDVTLVKIGKLSLVDLAGNERLSKSLSTGQMQKEAVKINSSLTALGRVISALSNKSSHIPYRDSILTKLFQNSLGGTGRALMIANIGPAASNYGESINTLMYAKQAKLIKNSPVTNQVMKLPGTTKPEITKQETDEDIKIPVHDCSTMTEKKLNQEHRPYHYLQTIENKIQKLSKDEDDLQQILSKDFQGSPTYKINLATIYRKSLHILILRYKMCKYMVDKKIDYSEQNVLQLQTNKIKLVKKINFFNSFVVDHIVPHNLQHSLIII